MSRYPIPAGRCQLCGCTYFSPCPGGCGWLNADRTLCTRCAALIVRCAAALLRQAGAKTYTTQRDALHDDVAPQPKEIPMWTCLAWVERGEHYGRCGAPTAIVDPVFGGPACSAHRRTTVAQVMVCRTCRQEIAPGMYFEFAQSIEKRRGDGHDPLICQPCLRRLLQRTIQVFRDAPAPAWEEE